METQLQHRHGELQQVKSPTGNSAMLPKKKGN